MTKTIACGRRFGFAHASDNSDKSTTVDAFPRRFAELMTVPAGCAERHRQFAAQGRLPGKLFSARQIFIWQRRPSEPAGDYIGRNGAESHILNIKEITSLISARNSDGTSVALGNQPPLGACRSQRFVAR